MKPYQYFTVFALVAAALIIAGCQPNTAGDQQMPASGNMQTGADVFGNAKVVEITSSGYSPNPLTVEAGETVTWINKDSAAHWIASAQHPTHKVYPGSDIEKCGTSDQPNIFDSCKGLQPGESWSFTFNNKGEWKYHDHLNCCTNSAFFGTVVVK